MNKPVLYLRIASVLTFIHAVLHTIGGVFGKIEPGPIATAVEAMKVNTFPLMGNVRSFWMFYRGMGLAATVSLTAESILMWQLASLAKTEPRRLRPMMATFLAAYLALAVNSNAYFFPPPVIVEILIGASCGMAIVTASKKAS